MKSKSDNERQDSIFTTPLNEDGLSMRWNLEQQLIAEFGRAVQQTLTHLESPVLIHGVTEQNISTGLTLLHYSPFPPRLYSIVHC